MRHEEDAEQEALFRWAAYMAGTWPELRYMHHIPNGGSRNKAEAARLKRQGVRAGVPDICLPAARGGWHGLYIELKRQKGGRASPEQREWVEYLEKAGYCARICHGWDEAREMVERYMRKESTSQPAAQAAPLKGSHEENGGRKNGTDHMAGSEAAQAGNGPDAGADGEALRN